MVDVLPCRMEVAYNITHVMLHGRMQATHRLKTNCVSHLSASTVSDLVPNSHYVGINACVLMLASELGYSTMTRTESGRSSVVASEFGAVCSVSFVNRFAIAHITL